MDFNSLAVGAPFYILQKADKPTLRIATMKSKSEPKPAYPTHTPNLLQSPSLVLDVVVNVNGSDVPFSNLPSTGESTTYNGGNTFVSCSREATLQAVDSMIQASKKALEQVDYHRTVTEVGERMIEDLNPSYAEGKQQARTIKALQERVKEQDRKLDDILTILQKLDAPTPRKANP